MATLRLYYRIEVKDRYGRVKKRTKLKPCNSFVLQFLAMIGGAISHQFQVQSAVYCPAKDTDGNAIAYGMTGTAYAYSFFSVFSADNNAGYGIVAGTGTTPPTNADYKLQTQIAHGVGAGQLDYGTHSLTVAQVVGSNVDLVISRTMYNGSGATITISEIGVYEYGSHPAGGNKTAMLIRDIITPVDIENGETVSIQYTLRTTV